MFNMFRISTEIGTKTRFLCFLISQQDYPLASAFRCTQRQQPCLLGLRSVRSSFSKSKPTLWWFFCVFYLWLCFTFYFLWFVNFYIKAVTDFFDESNECDFYNNDILIWNFLLNLKFLNKMILRFISRSCCCYNIKSDLVFEAQLKTP